MKNKASNPAAEVQLLELLKQVLPKATHDAKLAGRIYQAIETELKSKARAVAFEKFCAKVALPDLEAKSVLDVKQQFAAAFADGDVTVKADRTAKTLAVEVDLTDGSQFSGEIKVNPDAAKDDDGEQEMTLKFVPFPVCLPGDPELVWILARRENLTGEEGAMALIKAEEDFWASKTGQKLIRDRVDRSFPEFVARVPAGLLNEVGLKRHYKEPEPIQSLRVLKKS
ncbi:MAG: hypothetical protein ACYDC1_04230 [Limisphaerales bacterium]